MCLFILIEYIAEDTNERIFASHEELTRHLRESCDDTLIMGECRTHYLAESSRRELMSECIVEQFRELISDNLVLEYIPMEEEILESYIDMLGLEISEYHISDI